MTWWDTIGAHHINITNSSPLISSSQLSHIFPLNYKFHISFLFLDTHKCYFLFISNILLGSFISARCVMKMNGKSSDNKMNGKMIKFYIFSGFVLSIFICWMWVEKACKWSSFYSTWWLLCKTRTRIGNKKNRFSCTFLRLHDFNNIFSCLSTSWTMCLGSNNVALHKRGWEKGFELHFVSYYSMENVSERFIGSYKRFSSWNIVRSSKCVLLLLLLYRTKE